MIPKANMVLRFVLPAAMVVIGIGLSLLAFQLLHHREFREIQWNFHQDADERYDSLRREIDFDLQTLEAIAAFYEASREVGRAQFRSFVKPLLDRHQSIQALEWIPRVPASRRQAYEKLAERDGFPRFHFTERDTRRRMIDARQRDKYFPVFFVEPYKGNEAALGFDLASDRTREAALVDARDTGKMTTTSRVTLVQETARQPGVLVFAPVYRKQTLLSSQEDRRKNLTGFVLDVFRIGDIMEHSFSHLAAKGINVTLFDLSAPGNDRFLYSYPHGSERQTAPPNSGSGEGQLRYAGTFTVADRQWMAVLLPGPGYLAAKRSWEPWAALIVGLLFTAVLTSYFFMGISRARRIERLVKERTRDLSQANADLHTEITERTKAEEALRESEERYRIAIESSNDAVALIRGVAHVFVNQRFLDMFGYEREEVIDKSVFEITHPEDREMVARHMLKAKNKKTALNQYEFRVITKDGAAKFVEASVATVTYRGQPAGLAYLRDITERKKAELSLKESEESLRVFLDAIPFPAFLIKSDGTVIVANRALARSLGRENDPLAGQNLYSLTDSDTAKRRKAYVESIIMTGKPVIVEDSRAGRDFINYMYPVHDSAGSLSKIAVFALDITDRKRAEEEIRLLKHSIDVHYDAAFWMDSDSRFVYVNQAACKAVGYEREELIGKTIFDVSPDRSPESMKEVWERLRKKGSLAGESAYRRRDGTDVLVDTVVTYVKFSGREYACGFVRDVSEKKTLEAQLRQAQKLEALGTLTGGIAHDFNNMLAVIIGFAEVLKEEIPSGPGQEDLSMVLESATRGRDLVRQMLTFARQTEPGKRAVLLADIVMEATTFLRASIPATLDIQTSLGNGSGSVLGDPVQLEQVIVNLCTNAAHAMRVKGGTLTIELGEFQVSENDTHGFAPGSYVTLSVRDMGEGIPPENLEKIFDPFFTTKGPREGTGLGLSVVHGIVTSHGGYLAAESTPGKGSVFTVYLPRIAEETPRGAVTEEAVPAGHERILFVDDEVALSRAGQRALEGLGYQVTAMLSSAEALALFTEDPAGFDLVITDQVMPEMTGVEFARELFNIRADIPVILCTGYSYLVDAETARAAGINAFAMKPLTKGEIARTIRKVLEG